MRTAVPSRSDGIVDEPSGGASVARLRTASGGALVAAVLLGTLLRLRGLGRHVLNLDESFTVGVGRRDLFDVLSFLRLHDSHPPLDYLLRAPLARAGVGDAAVRYPSVVFSVAALACLAWWLRDRGWFGVLAVLLMAISGYQIAYGQEARMYALLGLLGVLAAMTTDAWLGRPSRGRAVAIGVVVLLAVFTHVSGLFLAGGLLLVAGRRSDRTAWEWRAAVAAPVVAFATLWGPSLLDQRRHSHTPAPRTSLAAVADAIGQQITTRAASATLALALVGAGIVALRRADGRVFRAALATAIVPVSLAAVVGFVTPILIPRFVMAFGWVVPVAVAAALVWVAERSRPLGIVAVAFVVLVFAASAVREATVEWPVDRAVGHLRAVAAPGDVVAASPAWYGSILDWSLGVHGSGGAVHAVVLAGFDDTHAITVGSGAPTGRVWLLEPVDHRVVVDGATSCAPAWTDGAARVRCLQF